MGWLTGMLSGFNEEHQRLAAEKLRQAEIAAQTEGRIYQALLEHGDPEIANLAGAGLLESAKPRKRAGGMAGWLGEMQQSQYLPLLRDYQLKQQAKEREQAVKPPAVAPPAGALPTPPPAANSAAQVTTSPTTSGPMASPSPAGATGAAGPPPQMPFPMFTGGGIPGASQLAIQQLPERQQQPAGAAPVDTASLFRPGAGPTAPPPTPPGAAAAAGAAGMGATSAAQPSGMTLPGVGAGAPPPPASLAPGTIQTGMPGPLNPPPPRPGQTSFSPPAPPPRTAFRLFPTAADKQRQQSRSDIEGTIEGYMLLYPDLPEAEARAKAAELYEDVHVRAGSGGMPYLPQYLEYTDPVTNETVQTMGSYDKRLNRYTDAKGQPFPAGAVVRRAQPASAMSGGALENQVARAHGWDKIDLINDPAKQQIVNDEITKLMVTRAGDVATERGRVAAANPLAAGPRVATMRGMQKDFNTFNAPIRGMQMYLTNMASAYKDLKAGKMVAWEPFRTAFVRTSEAASVVMPSEFGRSGQIGSVIERINGQIEQWLQGGGTLPPNLVDDMMQVGANMWTSAATYDQQYRSTVRQQLTDPALVGITEEEIFGPEAGRFDPWSIATPDKVQQRPAGGGGATAKPAPRTGAVYNPKTGKFEVPQ